MGMQEILRAYRLRNGYTQGQFAKILNIHRNTVANYESGRTEVPEMVKRRFEVLDKKEERTNKVIESTAITDNQKDYLIELQKEKIEKLENDLKNKKVQYQPHPTAFNEMVSMVESVQNTWNWTFLNSPTPMSIANLKGVIRSVNLSLIKQLGYNHPDDMKNKPVLDFIHPDDKEKAIKALSKDNRDLVCRIIKANGNYCKIHIIAKTFKAEFGDSFSVAQMKCLNKCEDTL
jgi:PAS domain S-box-containing protein